MSEKQKSFDPVPLSAEEAASMTELPFEFIMGENGSGSFEVPFKNIVEKAKWAVKKYNLAADDLCVMKRQLVIKKNGKLKYANANGLQCTKINIVQMDLQSGLFIVKAQVFFEGIDTPFEDIGMCERCEGGRSGQSNATILETASSRAILRAISLHLPMSIQDQPTEEQIETDIQQKYEAEQTKKAEKVAAAAAVKQEIRQTQQAEIKLAAPEREYNRRVKESKKAKQDDELLADLEREANELKGADE